MAVNKIDILLIRYCFSRIYVDIVASHNAFVTPSTLDCEVNIRTWRECIESVYENRFVVRYWYIMCCTKWNNVCPVSWWQFTR